MLGTLCNQTQSSRVALVTATASSSSLDWLVCSSQCERVPSSNSKWSFQALRLSCWKDSHSHHPVSIFFMLPNSFLKAVFFLPSGNSKYVQHWLDYAGLMAMHSSTPWFLFYASLTIWELDEIPVWILISFLQTLIYLMFNQCLISCFSGENIHFLDGLPVYRLSALKWPIRKAVAFHLQLLAFASCTIASGSMRSTHQRNNIRCSEDYGNNCKWYVFGYPSPMTSRDRRRFPQVCPGYYLSLPSISVFLLSSLS